MLNYVRVGACPGEKGGGGWLWREELGCERSFMIVISIFSNRTLCNHYFEQRNF